MKMRGVSLLDIQQALNNIYFSKPARNGGHEYVGYTARGRALKVWTSAGFPLVEPVIIKSVAWKENK
jgi:hypothetical protein